MEFLAQFSRTKYIITNCLAIDCLGHDARFTIGHPYNVSINEGEIAEGQCQHYVINFINQSSNAYLIYEMSQKRWGHMQNAYATT
jgi:hypothetical protein